MFTGEHTRRLDDDRLTIPRDWTAGIEDLVLLSWGQCVAVFPADIYTRFQKAPFPGSESGNGRMLARVIFSCAYVERIDSKRRIRLQEPHLGALRYGARTRWIGVDVDEYPTEVVVVGVGQYFEVWPSGVPRDEASLIRHLRSIWGSMHATATPMSRGRYRRSRW